jgi:3-oxoacyl-[acyl-carrier protein] reductase
MDLQYRDKVALVTGASSGLGRATAERLAEEGADVILVARREELLKQVADGILAKGGRATAIPCDLTDDASVRQLAAQVKERFGRLHLLVNNAGCYLLAPLQVTDMKLVREVIEINLVAVVAVTKAFLVLLKPGSVVINMASAGGIRGLSGISVYAATKGAVISLTRSLAKELSSRKVRVNAVAPGMVQTDIMERSFRKMAPQQIAAFEGIHPLGFGKPEDVAAAVAFMGSDQARWITGHILVVDGGLTL